MKMHDTLATRGAHLAFICKTLDEVEETRVAAGNRLNAMTRTVPDKDGEIRGTHPSGHHDVLWLETLVAALEGSEAQLARELEREVKAHPLGPWITAQRGVGLKQGGRLLGAIGDPYWNTLEDRPRTLAELWAYCGLVPGQRHRKGVQSNWSSDAKKRAWLIAQSIVKQPKGTPWRDVYDARRAATAERVHDDACVRCGPSGKPAPSGSPWSLGHQHADALRFVSKRLLRELWRESQRLYDAAPIAA